MHAVTRTFAPSIRQLPRSQLAIGRQSKSRASATPPRSVTPSVGVAAVASSPRSSIGNPLRTSIRHSGRRAFGSLVYLLTLHPVVTAATMADAPHSPYMDAGELSPEELAHLFSELQDPHVEANRRQGLERLIMTPVPASATTLTTKHPSPATTQAPTVSYTISSMPAEVQSKQAMQASSRPKKPSSSHSPCARERLIGYLPLETRTIEPTAPPGTTS